MRVFLPRSTPLFAVLETAPLRLLMLTVTPSLSVPFSSPSTPTTTMYARVSERPDWPPITSLCPTLTLWNVPPCSSPGPRPLPLLLYLSLAGDDASRPSPPPRHCRGPATRSSSPSPSPAISLPYVAPGRGLWGVRGEYEKERGRVGDSSWEGERSSEWSGWTLPWMLSEGCSWCSSCLHGVSSSHAWRWRVEARWGVGCLPRCRPGQSTCSRACV